MTRRISRGMVGMLKIGIQMMGRLPEPDALLWIGRMDFLGGPYVGTSFPVPAEALTSPD